MRSIGKTLAYGVADVLTLGRGIPRRISSETVHFPPRYSRYYSAEYEPETFRFLRRVCGQGDTVLDVGAHIGLFTVVIARLVGREGRVFAFEPTPMTRRVLERTVRLNHCEAQVEVRGEAVSGESGTSQFFDTADVVSNANSLVSAGFHRTDFTVETLSVDDFVSERDLSLSCLKIDVEGSELDVLRGAEATLRRDRPAMSLGLHPQAIRRGGGGLDEIWKIIASHRFDVAYLGSPVTEGWFCSQDDLFDVQCTPEE